MQAATEFSDHIVRAEHRVVSMLAWPPTGARLVLALVAGVFAAAGCERRGPPVRELAVAHGHGCALLENGTVRCWGYNEQGQLGTGDAVDRPRPSIVAGLTTATHLATFGSSTCAVLADGTARCWGWNLSGQLGGTDLLQKRPVPAPVPGLTGAVGIALGAGHGCAWRKDGAAFCWGENSAGQLGDGSSTRRTEATPVIDTGDTPLLGGVTSMALGQKHSCALLVDETVRCWGDDTQGQAGGGPRLRSRYAPVVIAGLGGVKAIAAGNYTTCALLADGAIRCWGGANSNGIGTPVPTAVEGIANATQISVGFGGACARIADGGIRCWGMDGTSMDGRAWMGRGTASRT